MSERVPGKVTVKRQDDGSFAWMWQGQRRGQEVSKGGFRDRNSAKSAGLKFAKDSKRNLR